MPVKLDGLQLNTFQSVLDKNALSTLKKVPFLDSAVRVAVDLSTNRMQYEFSAGAAFPVTNESYPDIYNIYTELCDVLCINVPPRLYIQHNPEPNAYTTGDESCIICMTTALVDICAKDEIRFILGHELGHVMCKHVKYHTLAHYLSTAGNYFIRFATVPMEVALAFWSRRSEVSADRAGLLACQNFDAMCSAMLKLTGYPAKNENIIPNAEKIILSNEKVHTEVSRDLSLLTRIYQNIVFGITADHPRIIDRYAMLRNWVDEGYYEEIINSTLQERIRISEIIDNDPMAQMLKMNLVMIVGDFLAKRWNMERSKVLPFIRKAFLYSDYKLENTPLQKLHSVILRVMRDDTSSSGILKYELDLIIADGEVSNEANLITLALNYPGEWEKAPEEFRNNIIQNRADLKVKIY